MENSENWSSPLPLRPSYIGSIPNDAIGIYVFWYKYNGRCIYVGKTESQSIRERVQLEYENSSNPQLKEWIECFGDSLEICYYPSDNIRDIDELETKFIHLWNPETNLNKRR